FKINKIVCSPDSAARQFRPVPGAKANSIGNAGSSDVTSTWASCSKSNQLSSLEGAPWKFEPVTRLRICYLLFSDSYQPSQPPVEWPVVVAILRMSHDSDSALSSCGFL